MFAHRQSFEDAGFLRRYSHRALGPLRLGDDIHPKHADRSRRGPKFGRQLSEKSCFARTVRADDRHDFATPHFKTDTSIRLSAVTVNFDKVAHLHGNLARWRGRESSVLYFNMRQAFNRGSQIKCPSLTQLKKVERSADGRQRVVAIGGNFIRTANLAAFAKVPHLRRLPDDLSHFM